MQCPTCKSEVNTCDSCGGQPPKLEHLQYKQTAIHACPSCAPQLKNNSEMLKTIAEKKEHH